MVQQRLTVFPQRNELLRVLGDKTYPQGHPLNRTGKEETVLLLQSNTGGHSTVVRAIVDGVFSRGEPLQPQQPSVPPPAHLMRGIKRKLEEVGATDARRVEP